MKLRAENHRGTNKREQIRSYQAAQEDRFLSSVPSAAWDPGGGSDRIGKLFQYYLLKFKTLKLRVQNSRLTIYMKENVNDYTWIYKV